MKEGLKPDLYCGRAAVLTTKHGMERAIARPFRVSLGLVITVKDEIDTDQLGTFIGEIERVGTPREVAIRKARLGMEAEETNFSHWRARNLGDLENFLKQAQFPSHALIVRPNEELKPGFLFKGFADLETLNEAVLRCAAASGDGWAHVETDMRAHVNPTRQKVIRRTASRLARRLATACPSCGAPGWGRINSEKGLPCGFCRTPTEMIKHEIFGCARCDYKETKPRSDGREYADQGQCPYCNP